MEGYINPIDRARDEALARRGLPRIAYVDNKDRIYDDRAPVVAIKRGDSVPYPIHSQVPADQLNAAEGVSTAQREAMLSGAMFGWHVPAADPKVQQELLDRVGERKAQKGSAA